MDIAHHLDSAGRDAESGAWGAGHRLRYRHIGQRGEVKESSGIARIGNHKLIDRAYRRYVGSTTAGRNRQHRSVTHRLKRNIGCHDYFSVLLILLEVPLPN